jgi:cellulose synthase operon protein C
MKSSLAACLFLSFIGTTCGAEPTLGEARSRWLHGNYEEARSLYGALVRDSKNHVVAQIGISRCHESQGDYDKALEVIQSGLQSKPDNPDLLARKAEVLYQRGRWDEAEEAAGKALAARADHFLGRWIRSQIYRDRGDWNKADDEMRWFVRTYGERSGGKNEIKDPEELVLVGLAATEHARWQKLTDQFNIVLNDIYGDAINNDKEFWPAEYQAGMLLLEKYDQRQALPAFDRALAINPNAAEAFVGKGIAALQKFEIRDAELFAARALRINPKLPDAHRLMADIHFVSRDVKAASNELEAARKINPRDENTLGRRAACLYLSRDRNAFDALVKETMRHNPKPAVFYHTLAEGLEQHKQYEAVEGFYKKAIQLQPWLPWPQNNLGLLYLRLGKEKEAQEILAKAFEADKFNVRVSNSLLVLQQLQKYQTVRTDHFELRFDPENDGRLARYITPYLEAIYDQLAEKFHYRPTEPILVEIFNDHQLFSGRIIALPDLHTIGASTGRIVAMASPNGRDIRRPFNWARVLRHELVHVFNLEQTRFQAPHWLTEGLAVIQEGFPRPQQWNELLARRVPDGEVMNLDNIDLGFIRPRSPGDWHMAYCQSQLYVEYIIKQYGSAAIGEMLNAYRDGLDTRATISKVCHVEKEVFEKDYRDYLERVSRPLHLDPDRRISYRQLQRAFESNPDDPDLAAQMAEHCFGRQDKKEARRLAEAVLAKKGSHPLASYVKARLLLEAGEDDQARILLESALNRLNPDFKVLQALGKLYYESRDFAKAADLYERAHKVQPHERGWLTQLLRVYRQSGDKEKQIEVLKQLVPTDADDLDMRKRLAGMLSDAGEHLEAERYAREALEIDVRDAEAREILLKSLEAQHKGQEADHIRDLLPR